jgi:hypothetical protein
MATDSAETLSLRNGNQKVYNSDQKLFRLGSYVPVGIMVYGASMFMGIDIEILIKEYRKNLGEKKFPHLIEYGEDFIKYLKTYKYWTQERQKDFLLQLWSEFCNDLKEENFHKCDKINDEILDNVIGYYLEKLQEYKKTETFKTDVDFISKYLDEMIEILEKVFSNFKFSQHQVVKLISFFVELFEKKYLGTKSGIVIAGYGEDEIFPSLVSYEIYGKMGKNFIYQETGNREIGLEQLRSVICPYAQTDMVYNFTDGIDPDFHDNMVEQIDEKFNKIAQLIEDDSKKEKISKAKEECLDYMYKTISEKYRDPVLDIVTIMGKQELAKIAESLVNITAFKRRMSKGSESVGGPVDVAVITKGDGFVWVKRKLYFNSDKQTD